MYHIIFIKTEYITVYKIGIYWHALIYCAQWRSSAPKSGGAQTFFQKSEKQKKKKKKKKGRGGV